MKNIFLIVFCFSLTGLIAQKGKVFPEIAGKTLNDKSLKVPIKNEKFTVLAIAFNRDAEDDLKKWLNPLIESFVKDEAESKSGFDMAEVNDVNFLFIPIIGGLKMIIEDFKKNTDKGFWPYILDTEKSDVKGIQKALNLEDNKIPYFFVLDKQGNIVEFQSGKYTTQKLEKLEEAIE